MKRLGKRLIKYGEMGFIGDEYAIPISEDTFQAILDCGDAGLLQSVLKDQVRYENYEAANTIKRKLIEKC